MPYQKILSLKFDYDLVFVAVLTKTNSVYSLDQLTYKNLEQPFEYNLVKATYRENFYKQIENLIAEEKLNFDAISLSYNSRCGFTKAILFDSSLQSNFVNEEIEWELSQIGKELQSQYHLAIPDEFSNAHERLIVAFHRNLVSFSNELASAIKKPLIHINFNLINLFENHLSKKTSDRDKNIVFCNIEDSFAEFGTYYFNMFHCMHYIDFRDGVNHNTLNIELRNYINQITSTLKIQFDKVLLTGTNVNKRLASNIADAILLDVELTQQFENLNVSEEIKRNEEIYNDHSAFAINIASALNAFNGV